MADVLTIREAVSRARAEGLPVSEYSLRRWVRSGVIPVRRAGSKQLLYFPTLVSFLRCEDGGDVQPVQVSGIRPLDRGRW